MNRYFLDFDEQAYLKSNPDVLKAVQNGSCSSGLEHYINHGYRENRPSVSSIALKNFVASFTSDHLPVPPEHLRKRVHGSEDVKNFGKAGRTIAMDMLASIGSLIELGIHDRILDFGCGCGRVFKYFQKLSPNSKFYGTDIDIEAIAWCQQHLSQIGKFTVNREIPPMQFKNSFFDFVYSISVFTHLPEEMESAWLEELRRVTKPGAYLLLTVHGEKLFENASEENKQLLRKKGFSYLEISKTEGLPDFYQTSFHTDDYIYEQWGKFFEIKQIISNGIRKRQDLILCRNSLKQ